MGNIVSDICFFRNGRLCDYKCKCNELLFTLYEMCIRDSPYTMLTKLYSRDNEHLMDLLNSKIQEIPGVTATETLISLEPVSYTHLHRQYQSE